MMKKMTHKDSLMMVQNILKGVYSPGGADRFAYPHAPSINYERHSQAMNGDKDDDFSDEYGDE